MTSKIYSIIKFFLIIFFTIGITMNANANDEDILLLELKDGMVTIQMKPEVAPNHVARIKELYSEVVSSLDN